MNGLPADLTYDPAFDLPLPSARQRRRTDVIQTDYVKHTLARLAKADAAKHRTLGRHVNRLTRAVEACTVAVDAEMAAWRGMRIAADRVKALVA